MAKKRKKNKAAVYPAGYAFDPNAPQPAMAQGAPWPAYGYGMPETPAMQMPTGTPNDPNLNAAYNPPRPDLAAGTRFAQGVDMNAAGLGLGAAGLGMATDPAAAYLKAAGVDAGFLQGLPNALRSRHSEQFLLGLLIGGAAAWVLSDEELRNKLLKTGLKLYSGLMGGLEELKEQVADVRAELDSEQ